MIEYRSTYCPTDNKLRLYATERLDKEMYEKVRSLGFLWAPKQKLFVAPSWSPVREDFLIELCGEVGDEDTTLVDRSTVRQERFDGYSEKRKDEAYQAKDAIGSATSVVAHHSSKFAEKEAKRVDRTTKKAVNLWDTARYWVDRARGAIQSAKYKETPAVRYRRIKGLESDVRKAIADFTPRDNDKIMQDGKPHVWCGLARGGHWVAEEDLPKIAERKQRWIQHYNNRIAYEKAMLAESGDIVAAQHDLKIGGRVLCGGTWSTIIRINKSDDKIVSVTTNNPSYPRVVSVEDIKDYEAPTEEMTERVKAKTKLPPMCNYPGSAITQRHAHSNKSLSCKIVEITQQQWDIQHKDYKGSTTVLTPGFAVHRIRYGMFGPRENIPGKYNDSTKEGARPMYRYVKEGDILCARQKE